MPLKKGMMSTANDNRIVPYDLLADYVDGLLDPSATARLDERLQEDEDSRRIVEGIRLFYAKYGHDRAALESYLDEFGRRLSRPLEQVRRRRRYRFGVVAAAVGLLLILAAGLWLRPGGPDQLVVQYLEQPYPPPYTLARGEETIDPVRRQIVLAYSQKDYRSAVNQLEELAKVEPPAAADRLLLGLSYLYLRQPAVAVPFFQQVLNQGDPSLHEPAEWYLALAFAEAGRWEAARPLLARISDTAGHFRQAEAWQLLDRLPK